MLRRWATLARFTQARRSTGTRRVWSRALVDPFRVVVLWAYGQGSRKQRGLRGVHQRTLRLHTKAVVVREFFNWRRQ